VTNITRPESTILFVGYQAIGTLGRQIVDGAKEVRILGQYYPVRARIAQLHGLSSHADKNELFRWLSALKRAPRRVFVVHGEPEATKQFSEFLREKTGWDIWSRINPGIVTAGHLSKNLSTGGQNAARI
jgi:metallo-beta-lactamase family protein